MNNSKRQLRQHSGEIMGPGDVRDGSLGQTDEIICRLLAYDNKNITVNRMVQR